MVIKERTPRIHSAIQAKDITESCRYASSFVSSTLPLTGYEFGLSVIWRCLFTEINPVATLDSNNGAHNSLGCRSDFKGNQCMTPSAGLETRSRAPFPLQ